MIIQLNAPWRKYCKNVPVGAVVLGIVSTRDDGQYPGALLKLANGRYARALGETLELLDSTGVELELLRARITVPDFAPPPSKPQLRLRTLNLDDATVEYFRSVGRGSASLGARLVAEQLRGDKS